MRLADRLFNPVEDLADTCRLAGILLLGATIISITLGNSPFRINYPNFLDMEISGRPVVDNERLAGTIRVRQLPHPGVGIPTHKCMKEVMPEHR